MDLNQLRIFLAVVDCGSFSRAAEALYISHSTTSRSVAALEQDLGVCLLQRDNRSIRLTAAGRVLYREGGQLLLRVETAEDTVRRAAASEAAAGEGEQRKAVRKPS